MTFHQRCKNCHVCDDCEYPFEKGWKELEKISVICDQDYEGNFHYQDLLMEYYMVKDEVWKLVGKADMLCFKHIEKRIGRKLKYNDFTDAPVNKMIFAGYEMGKRAYDPSEE